jgi:hypothetical protein
VPTELWEKRELVGAGKDATASRADHASTYRTAGVSRGTATESSTRSAVLDEPTLINCANAGCPLWKRRVSGDGRDRVAGRNLYRLTEDGLAFAIFYTKVHNRVLRPLMATDRPQAPPPVLAAMRTIDAHIHARLLEARLPSAAATPWTSAKVLATKDLLVHPEPLSGDFAADGYLADEQQRVPANATLSGVLRF